MRFAKFYNTLILKNTCGEEDTVARLETNDCLKLCGSKLNNGASFFAEDKKELFPEMLYDFSETAVP